MRELACAAFAFIVIVIGNLVIVAQTDMKPPLARKEPKVLKIHGYEITDNYAWLRDRDKKNPEMIKYLEENNAYTESFMGPHKGLVDTLYNEMLGRIKQTDLSVPVRMGAFWYFNKTEEGKQYPSYLRSKNRDGSDAEVLLDQNEMAKGFKFFSIGAFEPSDDGNMLAFSTDTTGYRQYTLQIKDLRSGTLMGDKIERVTSTEWSSDGKYLFYGQEDPVSKRNDKIFRHVVGTTGPDTLVYEEKDVLFGLGIGRSRDKKMFFINSNAATMTEARYLGADNPLGEWRMISARRDGHEYYATFDNGEFYILTNKDAENFKVVRAPAADPAEKSWSDYIAHNPAIKIDNMSFFKGHVIVSELENGLEYLRIKDRNKKRADERIKTPESVYTMGLSGNPEYETDVIRYNYSSMITPASTYEFNFATRKSELIKQQEIPSGHDKSKYETTRVWAVARDGVKVPVSIIMKKGTKLDGQSPMLLYAYGSYGASMTPNFSVARLSLVDRGMIYAIAHIRGGGELGEKWRQDGRMFKKMNTFNDFVDSAKWLVGNKYTSPDRLVIQGGSAGGLLMGAVVNQSPETFKAAIAQVPFVDVMNTMLDDTLPLTTGEWIEWGNPNEKAAWDYMVSYSPYENVKAQAYPNMLIEVSLNDSQVPYWEGAKWAAKLRELKTDKNVILLKTNMGAGHGGASGRYDRLKETAFDYAYALVQVGLTK